MHIILLTHRLAKARSLELSTRHLLAVSTAFAAAVFALALLISYFSVRHAAHINLPFLQSLVHSAQIAEAQRGQDLLRQNLNAMAVKVGEMQAHIMRLDALGERLSSAAGVRPADFRFGEVPGRGGAVPTLGAAHDLSLGDFSKQLDFLARQVETRSDYYDVLESQLLDQRVKQKATPTQFPVQAGAWSASSFGWRIDPKTGEMARHEGIDFVAEVGTPINAAAAGVVIAAESHPAYGLMVEIDHGNALLTRYAHASKLVVKPGQVVKRGEKIAEVGNTGRSTGPHLHFEVRHNGVAQNPAKFLYGKNGLARAGR
jgi:murein DD-endopeptidase MepM/ murein hydrolase activator NlpD